MASKAESKEVEEEKVQWKPGQKFATPSPGNGDRVFYETLFQQKPESEMAQEWVLTYGILSAADAQKLLDKMNRRKGGAGAAAKVLKSPERKPSASAAAKPAAGNNGRKSKVVIEDEVGEDDGAMWESKGRVGV